MAIISSAAHFSVCAHCKSHGRVVTAVGQLGPENCSKEEARLSLKIAFEKGVVLDDEGKVVRDQINSSPLPETNSDADLLSRMVTEYINSMSLESGAGRDEQLTRAHESIN